MTANVVAIKGAKLAPRSVRSRMDTIAITPKMVSSWLLPPFQRELKVNEKVRTIAEEIREDLVVPGVLTLGELDSGGVTYIIDGQHRIEAFKIADVAEAYADVRICRFEGLGEMGEHFVELNSAIARFSPDDVLRGLEGTVPALNLIRQECPFVGYANIRRSGTGPLIGMSQVLRSWSASRGEVPSAGGGKSAMQTAQAMDVLDAQQLAAFLNIARIAWGSDPANYRLWGGLNIVICMWMFRQLVLDKERGVKRYVVLTRDQFKKCLMSVSANPDYLDWLVGRNLNDRDRSPCFARIKAIFASRLREEVSGKVLLPQPGWAS
jgi:hypothetical protein